MDRRDFIRISGTAAAGLGIAACTGGKFGTEGNGTGAGTKGSANAGTGGTVIQNFPGTGLLGYGCMRWPMKTGEDGLEHIDQEEVNRLVDEAIAHGVTYFDTSPVYLGGDSERATAEALNRHPRSKWTLATKLSNFSNWTYDNSVLMYRRSLEIFNTDHIDYYLLHSVGNGGAFEQRFGSTGIMDFLLKEREAGHIRNLGFSFHGDNKGFEEMMNLHDKYHWDFVQIQMNYLDWTQQGNAKYLYEGLTARGIPVVIMEPLRGGGLATVPASLADRLKEKEPGQSIASWAFRFAGSFPNVLSVLSGMTYMDHLQDNLRTFCDFKPLGEAEMAMLEDVAAEMTSYPLIRCTGCQYCMPCPYGIDIPGVFRFYNDNINEGTYIRTSEQKDFARARRRYLTEYDKSIESIRQADHCIGCGKCMKACPQHIRIPVEMRRIDEYVERLKKGEI